jgi:hypothetical protein
VTARTAALFPKGKGQALVRLRSDVCEACGAAPGQSFSHRIAASRGGTYAPSNGIRACGSGTTGCHGWFEHHPTWGGEGGWQIRRTLRTPLEVPAFLVTPEAPFGGWYLLDDENGREGVFPDDFGLPEVPAHLPPGHVRLRTGRPLSTVPWVEP